MLMPKGEYYIGDPCYIIPKDDWHKFCDVLFDTEEDDENEDCCFGYKGHFVCVDGTMYGDGTYHDMDGNRYSVDAGLIGCIPKVLWDKKFRTKKGKADLDRHAQFVKFDNDFFATAENGRFQFGHIGIETGDEGDDEEENWCECY